MTGKYIKKQLLKLIEWFKNWPYYVRRWYCRKRIKSRDFTIISNNCWAGKVYQYLNMPYLSPTVGLYFFADDYIKFVKNLQYYCSLDLHFISVNESKYREILIRRKEDVPIGCLDDIEIVFRHYKTSREAEEKWNRRKARINWDNLIIKFSRMNCCTESHIKEFDALSFKNKFVFNNSKKTKYKSEIYWPGPQNDNEILLDTKPFPGKISLIDLINK